MRIQPLLLIILIALACVRKKETSTPQIIQLPTSEDFRKAEHFDSLGQQENAFQYFYETTRNSKDSFLRGMAYAYMARIQQDAGDFSGVQGSAIEGIRLLSEDSSLHIYTLASLYNNLGRSYVGLKTYKEAIEYYRKAIKITPDREIQNVNRNNIAVALRENGDYKEALDSFLAIEVSPNERREDLARRMTNLASLKWKVDENFNPLPDLHNALRMRIEELDTIGITASYNHLAAYYQVKNTDSALYYGRKMYALAKKKNSADDQLDALKKLITLTPKTESRQLFGQYLHLADSIQVSQNSTANQFAVIRFESDRSKAQNKALQEDNAQKELQILRQRVFVIGSIAIAALIVIFAVWRYRKKKQQMKIESQAAIQENQLKISQRIHDTVANGLYRVMTEIEHADAVDKEPLLDRIEDLYERSRNLSYETIEKENNIASRINQLITAFATSTTKISVVGNKDELWKAIPSMVVKELEQVLQELMVNMKKHSRARHVVLNFSKTNDSLIISYKDDGQGFPPNFEKGNGLKSTENRIKEIGGQITFAEETASGAAIKILIPILSNDQKSINS